MFKQSLFSWSRQQKLITNVNIRKSGKTVVFDVTEWSVLLVCVMLMLMVLLSVQTLYVPLEFGHISVFVTWKQTKFGIEVVQCIYTVQYDLCCERMLLYPVSGIKSWLWSCHYHWRCFSQQKHFLCNAKCWITHKQEPEPPVKGISPWLRPVRLKQVFLSQILRNFFLSTKSVPSFIDMISLSWVPDGFKPNISEYTSGSASFPPSVLKKKIYKTVF